MKLIDRYLCRQFLTPFLYCLVGLSVLIVTWDLFDHFTDFMTAHAPLSGILRYYSALLATALEYVLPSCLLLATLYAFWQMTRANEIVAMRSAGISLYRVMVPFLAVGLAATATAALIKEYYAPRAAEWSNAFSQNHWVIPPPDILEDYPYYSDQTHRQWVIDQIDTANPNILYGVTLRQERPDHSTEVIHKAQRAYWLDGAWWFMNLEQPKWFYPNGAPITNTTWRKAWFETWHSMPELTERPTDFLQNLKIDDFKTIRELLYSLQSKPTGSQSHAELQATISRRLAVPWACLIVTFFAVPAGNKGSRQSPLNGILTAMGFFLAYYALLQLGTLLGTRQIVSPELGPWLANIVFALTGGFMLFRMR